MSNDLLIDKGYMLRASKRIAHKEHVSKLVQTYVGFLLANNLIENTAIAQESPLPDDFKLWEVDLTEVGIEFYDKTFFKWVGKVDKGLEPDNTKFLDKVHKELK